jgi:hypothetical protein
MAEEKVKLPRSSYDELCKIIQAYGRLEEPGSLDQVNVLAGVGKTVISANNLFLTSIGLIERGKAKSATSRGRELAAALEHGIADQIQKLWASVVHENEFLNKMGLAVRIRRSMEGSALEAHIAYSAGEAKSSQVMTGARAVIDILRAAGVVKEKDGQLVPGESSPELRPIESDTKIVAPEVETPPVSIESPIAVTQVGGTGATVRIDLRIDAKPSELEGLGVKIRRLLDEIQGREGVESGGADTSS